MNEQNANKMFDQNSPVNDVSCCKCNEHLQELYFKSFETENVFRKTKMINEQNTSKYSS